MNHLKHYRLDNASGKSKEPQGSGSEKCLQAESQLNIRRDIQLYLRNRLKFSMSHFN
ncbi:hypothetical protein [Staphylococcus equorum]|uniref:hypothetical protein n=1 Tax=Staphylococcus equorum TaxID=246432 RepID=UPI0025554DAA|nr:hypothetical protein [Staphylococcus equorum]MDK9850187.1 hypothetical protein [Staphylococcus equorum]